MEFCIPIKTTDSTLPNGTLSRNGNCGCTFCDNVVYRLVIAGYRLLPAYLESYRKYCSLTAFIMVAGMFLYCEPRGICKVAVL